MGMDITRNPDYFETGLPFLDQMNVSVIRPDPLANAPGSAELDKIEALKDAGVVISKSPAGLGETLLEVLGR